MKLRDIILFLENEMCVLGTPLIAAFGRISEENAGGVWSSVFKSAADVMKNRDADAGSAWRTALHDAGAGLPLDRNEIEVLSDFGELLGKSDREMQHAILNMEKEKIACMEIKAREAAETQGKLYRNLGALTGAAAVILLI
jgi:stage III sporulation protein AB